jgi:DNA polymerase III gamma/tau subunit
MFGVKTLKGDPDFHELNSADSRGIDDMRKMLQIARLQPRKAVRRVFLFDEAQGFTGDSSRLLLKPLEEPPKKTLFMLGSMEPEKLDRAMKNRCQQFILNAPSQADMTKFVKRIVKGEELKYMTDDLIKVVVDNSNGEMRAAALIMEAVTQTMHGQKKIKAEDILKVLDSVESSDDALSVEILASVYKLKLGSVYRHQQAHEPQPVPDQQLRVEGCEAQGGLVVEVQPRHAQDRQGELQQCRNRRGQGLVGDDLGADGTRRPQA